MTVPKRYNSGFFLKTLSRAWLLIFCLMFLYTTGFSQPCIAPTVTDVTICKGTKGTLIASSPGDTYIWRDAAGNKLYSGNEFTTPNLNVTTVYLLEVITGDCVSPRTAVTVTVAPYPQAPSAKGINICAGSTATLTASGPGGLYEWFSTEIGGEPIISSPDFTTPVLNNTTTYYVQTTLDGCQSPRTPVTITVNAIPAAPQSSGMTICSGLSATLTATGGNTYQWFPAAIGGEMLATGDVFTTPVLSGSTTYYVQTLKDGCVSARTPVTVTVNQFLLPPVSSDISICSGFATLLTASGSDGTYEWYDAQSGGNLLASGPEFSTPVLNSSTSYYVQTSLNGCASERIAVKVTVADPVPAPVIPDATIVEGQTAILTASGPADTYSWYDSPSGGNKLIIDEKYTTTILLEATKFYVEASLNGCTSPRTEATVFVNPAPSIPGSDIPAAPVASGKNICYGTAAVLSASTPGGICQWYDSPIGGNLIVTSPTYVTPRLTATTSYYVQTSVLGIVSARTLVRVTVGAAITPPRADGITVCPGNSSVLKAVSPDGGILQWFDAIEDGTLLGVGASYKTSLLTRSATYYVETTLNGCSSERTPVIVNVERPPMITSASSQAICSGAILNYSITADRQGTTFIWSREALLDINNPALSDQKSSIIAESLVNTGTLPIDVIYSIIPIYNGCQGLAFNYIVTVYPSPVLINSNKGSVCNQTPVDFTPIFSIAGSDFSWSRSAVPGISNTAISGQASTTIRESLTNMTNAPIDVTYIFNQSFEGCPGLPVKYMVTVNPVLEITGASVGVVCNRVEHNYQIKPNLSGSSFKWSRDAVPGIGNASATGETFSDISETLINTAGMPIDVGYHIIPFINGCPGVPFDYVLTVNPDDQSVVEAGRDQSVCSQSPDIILEGKITGPAGGRWISSGTGRFLPSDRDLDATYVPSISDIQSGGVKLILQATGTAICNPKSDDLLIKIIPEATIDMGPDQYTLSNNSIALNPKVSDDDVEYLWTPNIDLSDNTIRNPVFKGRRDQKYTLRVTTKVGCITEEAIMLYVLYPVIIPNTFTPNGDGVNDLWNIAELPKYPGSTVTVYNRNGAKIFTSAGYAQSWDGTYNGQNVPVGTYYYIINSEFGGYSGSITILR